MSPRRTVTAGQQLLPGFDAGRAAVLSPSALERYRLCPRLYRFLYVDGQRSRSRMTAPQSFGTTVHAALREFFRLPVARRSLDGLLELFKRSWVREGYRNAAEQDRERARGVEALRAWYERADTTVVPQATELSLQAAWRGVVFKGRLDRVDADRGPVGVGARNGGGNGGGLVVVDYKTGRRPVTQAAADADEALTIYAALVERRLERPVTGLVLDFVVAGEQIRTERPPEVLRERLGEILDVAATLRKDERFTPRTGPWCASCEMLGLCPEGQREIGRRAAELD
ncbi:MAG TPA: PD-(D/E)XK nuclease family protein [Actinomycetota bacterium]